MELKTISRRLTIILIAGIALINTKTLQANEPNPGKTESLSGSATFKSVYDTTTIFFRVSYTLPDRNFKNNGQRLDSLFVLIDSLRQLKNVNINKILLIAGASPEGPAGNNKVLAQKRADHIAELIADKFQDLKPVIETIPLGEDWDGTIKSLESAENIPHKSEALRIMKNVPLLVIKSGKVVDSRKRQLMNLNYGRTWNAMLADFFPELRRTRVVIDYQVIEPEPKETIVEGTLEPTAPIISESAGPIIPEAEIDGQNIDFNPKTDILDNTISIKPIESEQFVRHTIIAAKTNLLYDAVTALNFEVEVPIGNHFSVAVEDVFPWWTCGPNDRKYAFQMWEMGLEPRWWFKKNDQRDRLTGHFAGIYGMASKYDFQWDYNLCYQGEYWSAGLTYGYSMKISRLFNLEFSFSAGFMSSDYRHYVPGIGYEHLYRDRYKTGKISYFGPTKLKVSLVLPIRVKYKVRVDLGR